MSAQTMELLEVCDRLPADKQAAVADFARFLLSREPDAAGQEEEEDGDAAWERIINDPRPRPKLEAFFAEAEKEPAEPLDLDRL